MLRTNNERLLLAILRSATFNHVGMHHEGCDMTMRVRVENRTYIAEILTTFEIESFPSIVSVAYAIKWLEDLIGDYRGIVHKIYYKEDIP
jgi:hypothetical protein